MSTGFLTAALLTTSLLGATAIAWQLGGRGLDYVRQGFNQWDLTREVLKAFDTSTVAGAKR